MTDQLQDLLQRVYDEGVAKANAEADQILEAARKTAEKTIEDAKTEATAIVSDAQSKAEELKKNSDTDLKMAAQHTLSSVKQALTDVVMHKVLDTPLKTSFNDATFLKEIILAALDAWKSQGGEGGIVIAESLQGKLDDAFISSLDGALQSGLKVEFSSAVKNGFNLVPADGGYKLSFTDEDFANLFKGYLRPRTSQILFPN